MGRTVNVECWNVNVEGGNIILTIPLVKLFLKKPTKWHDQLMKKVILIV